MAPRMGGRRSAIQGACEPGQIDTDTGSLRSRRRDQRNFVAAAAGRWTLGVWAILQDIGLQDLMTERARTVRYGAIGFNQRTATRVGRVLAVPTM
jgi:hypothetical protein